MIEYTFEPVHSGLPFFGYLFALLMSAGRKLALWFSKKILLPALRSFFAWLIATFSFAAPVIRSIGNWLLARGYMITVFLFYMVIIIGVLVAAILAVLSLYSLVRMATPPEVAAGLGLIIPSNLKFVMTLVISAEILAFIYRVQQKAVWEWAKLNYNNPPKLYLPTK